MGGDNIRRTVYVFDEKDRISANIRDGGVAAGVGDRVGGGDGEDADAAFVRIGATDVATDVVTRRPNRDRGSIRGETYTHSTVFIDFISRNIQTHLRPPGDIRIFVNADTAFVGAGIQSPATCVVLIRPNRNHCSIRGKTYTISIVFKLLRPRNIQSQLTPSRSIVFEDADTAFVCIDTRGFVVTIRPNRNRRSIRG